MHEDKQKFKIKLLDLKFQFKRVTLSPEIFSTHMNHFSKGGKSILVSDFFFTVSMY